MVLLLEGSDCVGGERELGDGWVGVSAAVLESEGYALRSMDVVTLKADVGGGTTSFIFVEAGMVMEEAVLCFFFGRLGDGYVAGVMGEDGQVFFVVLIDGCPC